MRLNPEAIKQQVDGLLTAYPELAEDEQLRLDMLEGSTDLVEFMRKLETARQNACAMSDAIATLIKNWQLRKETFDRRDEAMRNLMLRLLQAAHLKKLEMPEATLSVRLGVPRVVIVDETEIPDEFCRIKKEPDKTKIKAALSEFKPVPGATLSNAEDGLTVRVK
jgi:hypothetical protein